MDTGVSLLKASLPITRFSSSVQPTQGGGSMKLVPNREIFDCRSLLAGLMGGDAAGQDFAHRYSPFFFSKLALHSKMQFENRT